ncbi:alpha/beta fold hydrolase [Streptomyces caatingaensis]|uniref:Lipase n=1 Tax=Streptomyces caatingaensis TaxID=1678637 RepID=A0A0K9XAR4_9ACTN|nr:alpha/beta hydrolase [Streptomyces caatingaensis]KNB50171.1 lipase [Streptomyces caatingaensis]
MTESGRLRGAGLAGAAVGVLAAGAAAGVAVERLTVGRGMRRKARLALDATGPYGTLRGTPGSVAAEDGTELSYEVDDGPSDLTVVLSHGYCLNQDSWHFQRAALREAGVRAVYWDQRSHGRSERSRTPSPSIELLGRDLAAVIRAAAPAGPLVLAGHSMGGMTQMALAGREPELVAERVAGAAFVGTSSGRLAELTFGLPAVGMSVVRRVLPGAFRLMTERTELVERGRRLTADLLSGVYRRYSFGPGDVDPAVARFAERLLEATPVDVVADFYPAFAAHEGGAALRAFRGRPVLVLAGEKDLVTPCEHSEAVAAELPEAELVVVPGAGHLVMLERPDAVGERLAALLDAARATARA